MPTTSSEAQTNAELPLTHYHVSCLAYDELGQSSNDREREVTLFRTARGDHDHGIAH